MKKIARLFKPLSLQTATRGEIKLICNGCGSAQAKVDFVPDRIWGLKIGDACLVHDWMYYKGKTADDKSEADRVFLNNMIRLIDANSNRVMKTLRRRRAKKYYLAVKYFAGDAFWANKNP